MYHYVCNHCVKWDPEWLDFALFSGVNIEAMSLFLSAGTLQSILINV